LDAISNSLEKVAFGNFLMGLLSKIPGFSKIKTKEDAFAIVWDAVKKIGAQNVLRTLDDVMKLMGSAPQPGILEEKEASSWEELNRYIKSAMSPILVLAFILLFKWLGAPGVEKLKQNIQHMQQQQIEQLEAIK
jgi:hypothetical protein